jgi:hypothetical protein
MSLPKIGFARGLVYPVCRADLLRKRGAVKHA